MIVSQIIRALMNTLSDFEFDSAQFEKYVQHTFSSLFTLLREAKECETKMAGTVYENTIRIVILCSCVNT